MLVRTKLLMSGVAAAVTAVALCACESMNTASDAQPRDAAGAAGPGPGSTGADGRPRRPLGGSTGPLRDSTELQAALFGYADTYMALTSEAADKLLAAAQTPENRALAIRMKLDGSTDVVKIVSGPNVTVALMDLASMVSIQRKVWEEYWATQVFTGPAAESYTAAIRRLEREAWRIVEQSIPAEDVTALQDLAARVQRWYRNQVHVTSIRVSAMTREIEGDPQLRAAPSLLSLFGMDPLANLSPAVVEVTKSRLLAERALFYTHKLPILVEWRTQLSLANTMTMPEAEKALQGMDSTIAALDEVAELARGLPNVIAHNRAEIVSQTEAALTAQVTRIEDILEKERVGWIGGVAAERQALLEAFDERHVEAKAVMGELRETIAAADKLTTSVQGVLVEVKAMSEEDGASDPGRPFDIREYQQAIESATVTLRELNTTVQSARELVDSPQWEQREAGLRALADDVHGRLARLIVYASIGLGLALFVGLSGAFVVRRMLSQPRVVRVNAPASLEVQ